MASLADAYQRIVQADQEKIASSTQSNKNGGLGDAPDELIKKAADYENVGRILAHQVFEDLVKEAAPVGHGEGNKHSDNEWCDDSCGDYESADGVKLAEAKQRIIERMAADPSYVAKLAAKHADKFR